MSLKKLLFTLIFASSITLQAAPGWIDLFPKGETGAWRSARNEDFPSRGWSMKDDVLTVHKAGGEESRGGGDIITRKRYSDFELELEFRMTSGCNSGIKFLVQPNLSPIDRVTGKPTALGSAIGPEFQILDDARHPDAKAGRNGNRKLGSLYDLIPAPADKVTKPIGEWNEARILVKGAQVTFWLNGQKTVEFDRRSTEFRNLVAQSKYDIMPDFAAWNDGHILLQDHGDEVSFRHVRIRDLSGE